MHFLSKKIYFMKIDSPPKPTISPYKHYVLMCTGPRCGEEGAGQALYDSLWQGGPVMCVQPQGTWYYNVTPTNLDRIIAEHLVGDQAVQDLVFHHSPQVDVPAQRSVLS